MFCPRSFAKSTRIRSPMSSAHFRRQLKTKVALRQVARARGEMLKRLVGVLDEHVDLPMYQISEQYPGRVLTAWQRTAERGRILQRIAVRTQRV